MVLLAEPFDLAIPNVGSLGFSAGTFSGPTGTFLAVVALCAARFRPARYAPTLSAYAILGTDGATCYAINVCARSILTLRMLPGEYASAMPKMLRIASAGQYKYKQFVLHFTLLYYKQFVLHLTLLYCVSPCRRQYCDNPRLEYLKPVSVVFEVEDPSARYPPYQKGRPNEYEAMLTSPNENAFQMKTKRALGSQPYLHYFDQSTGLFRVPTDPTYTLPAYLHPAYTLPTHFLPTNYLHPTYLYLAQLGPAYLDFVTCETRARTSGAVCARASYALSGRILMTLGCVATIVLVSVTTTMVAIPLTLKP
eukprot:2475349-Rhodomonas_salina.2